MTYRVRLLRTAHHSDRKLEVEGVCLELPKRGESFLIFTPQEVAVRTTPITTLFRSQPTHWTFTTKNSTYRLEFLP